MDISYIITGIQSLSYSIQIYKNLKDLTQDIQHYINKSKSPASNWCIYISPLDRFKISWPTQRWTMREIGSLLPTTTYVNVPVQLRFKLSQPLMIPNLIDPTMTLFHNLVVTVDLHGSIDMETYVKTNLDLIPKAFELFGGKFHEERSAHKVEENNATIAGRIIFNIQNTANTNNTSNNTTDPIIPTIPVTLWKIMRIIRSRDRMYNSGRNYY